MNKVLLGAALVAATSTTVLAADLPSRRAPPVFAPPIVAPAFSWSGFYFGGTAGYAFDGKGLNSVFPNTPGQGATLAVDARPGFVGSRSDGFTGGGTIGYNFQLGGGIPLFGTFAGILNSGLGPVLGNSATTGGFVVGIEADAAYTDLRSDTNVIGTTGANNNFYNDTQFVGTVRGRLGYAVGDILFFGTGGFAYGSVRTQTLLFPGGAPATNAYSGATNSLRTGYAYGGGVEYAIPTTSFLNFFKSSAVTVKAEFIHFDLGSQQSTTINAVAGGVGYGLSTHTEGNLVRAGLNYKIDFNPAPAPVVARY